MKKEMRIIKTVSIKVKQGEFLERHSINLSRLVQNVIEQLISAENAQKVMPEQAPEYSAYKKMLIEKAEKAYNIESAPEVEKNG